MKKVTTGDEGLESLVVEEEDSITIEPSLVDIGDSTDVEDVEASKEALMGSIAGSRLTTVTGLEYPSSDSVD